ncbi:thioesterase family protein [Nocardioides kribbensis]|uniref:thioesterase family protein n=1 Tax=Nocardioides kribbensis TaxID=305517 RepID=UPI0029D411F7|nr:thioesterase family protein [Nocardioides kribbensis]
MSRAVERPDRFFDRLGGGRFLPTDLTGGAWSTAEQHISPFVGLLVHEVERDAAARAAAPADTAAPAGGARAMTVSRVSVDILGVIGPEEVQVDVEVLRPGRTIELVEATLRSAGRAAARARVWRLATRDTSVVAGGAGEPLPPPHDLPTRAMTDVWPGGYIAGLDVRAAGEVEPGRGRSWISTTAALVAGEPASALARLLGLVDTANGLAVRTSPQEWAFPNLDLTVHLVREPQVADGDPVWLGLDTTVVFGPDGVGLTSSVLHDLHGPVGRAAQVLTLRPR